MQLDPVICYQAVLARDPRFDGRFFTAVKSTGIYCRPVCPARHPKYANCRFMASAAAAQEAGYRPCLRCRPEVAPRQGAWHGTSNSVSRALALIEAGALDEAGIEALAARVGLGARHLRRLFQHHIGASPVAVAQTRRVLLAKQLIHESAMSMADIAHASGFGSVRRFNEIFQRLFARPPASLRRGRGGDPTAALTLSLGYRPPYDWAGLCATARHWPDPATITSDHAVCRLRFACDGVSGSATVTIQPARHRLRATIAFADPRALPKIIAQLRQAFDLDADPAVIATALSRDPRLAPLVVARPGLRVPGWGHDWPHDGFADPDAFPAIGSAALAAMAERGGWPSVHALHAAAERWRPWRAYAAALLEPCSVAETRVRDALAA